jgi:hypothetical protein
MHNAIPLILAALIAVGIIVIGCFYLLSPERISGTFGLKPPASDADTRAWLRTKGIRDVASMAGDVKPDLFHHGNGLGSHGGSLRARREHLKAIARLIPKQSFGHLTSRRVADADDQNSNLAIQLEILGMQCNRLI